MKYHVLAACILVIITVVIAGCTQGTTTPPAPAGTQAVSAAAPATPQITFALGDHYLQKSYSFQSEKDVRTEQFRVDNPAWGIDIVVLPLNDDPQYCWFEMTVTNMDNGQTDTYGFGRTHSYEKHQQFPMYVTGPYK
ncbi:hypothetical protein, partial [Methanoregula sp.]|uniref:hypothetical protein n=1 Tax=Methanoregula sp. TaxID=2052170 RepID=UPI000CBF0791